jgi:hypothetical protein
MSDSSAWDSMLLGAYYERLVAAATKVLGDWRASQSMAGQEIDGAVMPPAVKWASLAELDAVVTRRLFK